MLRNYLLLAWKVLGRRRLFTAISLFGVAFTLLVLIVGSALLDHVFAPHAPEGRFGRVLGLWGVGLSGPQQRYSGLAGQALITPLVGIPGVEEMAIFSLPRTVQTWVDGRQLRLEVKRADRGYWRVLDFTFLAGEPWSDDDDRDGRPVAVISRATERAVMPGGGSAVGAALELDGRRFTVVGVVPDVPVLRLAGYADVWVPLAASASSTWRGEQQGSLVALFLARNREAFPTIRSEVHSRLAAITPLNPNFQAVHGEASSLFAAVASMVFGEGDLSSSTTSSSVALADSGPPPPRSAHLMAVLVALALLFMALPAVNLANIHQSRIRERATEIGVRRAFGAPSRSLLAQFLVENLLLTLLGAAIGLVAAAATLAAVEASGAIPHAAFSINWRIALWALGAAVAFGLLSGVYPAWRMSRLEPVSALRGRS